jgi:hypothetical protein
VTDPTQILVMDGDQAFERKFVAGRGSRDQVRAFFRD